MPMRPPSHRTLRPEWARQAWRELDRRRGSAAARGYGWAWKRIADEHKRKHPHCVDPFGVHKACGIKAMATHVDHIVPRRRGGMDDESNLQGLCASCHSRKTCRQDGGFGNQVVCQPPGGE